MTDWKPIVGVKWLPVRPAPWSWLWRAFLAFLCLTVLFGGIALLIMLPDVAEALR